MNILIKILTVILLIVALMLPANAAISFTQYKVFNNGSSSASCTATFTNPIAAGSIIAVMIAGDLALNTFTIANDKGDSPTDSGLGITSDIPVGVKQQTAAFLTATSGAQAITVTANPSGFIFCELVIWEIAGLTSATFDKAVTAAANGPLTTSPDSGPTGTLSSSNEAAIGFGISNNTYTTQGSGWSLDEVTSFGDIVEHRVVSSNASINATATTGTAVDWRMWCATFMGTGAAATAPLRTLMGAGK